jgi:hypothetical protein
MLQNKNIKLELHSNFENPYDFYKKMRNKGPVVWASNLNAWILFKYDDCYQILNSDDTSIPINKSGLELVSKKNKKIISHLPRVTNSSKHTENKQIALSLAKNLKLSSSVKLLKFLLPSTNQSFDWVHKIALELPVLNLLNEFSFSQSDTEYLTSKLYTIKKLTSLQLDETNIIDFNTVIQHCFNNWLRVRQS